MKNPLCFLAVCLFFPAAGLCAASDCGRSPDACQPQPVKLTPFMAELKKAARPTELKQGPAVSTEAGTEAAAPAPLSATPAASIPSPVSVQAEGRLPQKEIFSRPGWLVAAALFLYGLYYFLKTGKKKRRYK